MSIASTGGRVLAVDVGRVTNGSAGRWLSGAGYFGGSHAA
jgi:hypothetical protein